MECFFALVRFSHLGCPRFMGLDSHRLLYLGFIVFQFFCFSRTHANSDESALLQFKRSVSDAGGVLSSWDSSTVNQYCSWQGIACDSSSRVVALNISGGGDTRGNPNYSSSSPCSDVAHFPPYGFGSNWNRKCLDNGLKLVGKLSPVIANLTELRVLSLPFNRFSGVIPDEIWAMKKLEVLDLEGNSVSGSLPPQSPGHCKLRVLNLGFNEISGEIPKSLSNCVGLEILNLAGNDLNGTIPEFVGGMGELRGVYMSSNELSGPIPIDIGHNCTKLEHFDLSGNLLVGGIPVSLGNCNQLRSLLLYSNMFENVIPAELGSLEKLDVLDVSRNSLTGSIPIQLGNCSNLSVLVLSNLFDPSLNIMKKGQKRAGSSVQLSRATDDYNFFQGNVPIEVSTLPKLKILWAPRASLDGMLPSNWGSCEGLVMLNLAQNYFRGHGEFLDGLSHCRRLQFLNLSSNRLIGELPHKLPVPCMTLFDVSRNRFSGPIPEFSQRSCEGVVTSNRFPYDPENLASTYMSFFVYKTRAGTPYPFEQSDDIVIFHNFDGNKFTSVNSIPIAPDKLGKQSAYAFSASRNKLSFQFPGKLFEYCDELGAMIVDVSGNSISGEIPKKIGSICSSLKFIDASMNQITGFIPPSMGDLVNLVSLDLSKNQLQGQIPANLGQIRSLKHLSLSNNYLTGPIPSSLGQLRSLELLELSSNSISGEIPSQIANLSNLTVLLLNNNKLSGHIPSGLEKVTKLSAFNASFNNFSGKLLLTGNLNCSSLLGNPLVGCSVVSLAGPSSKSQGTGDSQNYAASAPLSPSSGRSGNGSFNSIEVASIASASAIVAVLLGLIVLFIYTRKWKPRSTMLRSSGKEVTVFTEIGVPLAYENVVQATGIFSKTNLIGSGGFGATYKAEISPGILVAVKRLSVGRFQGIQQFHAEIKTLGRLRHSNLVTLIGYHASESEMFLVYNYLPGGNLEEFIQERSMRAVDWRTLHKIAVDIASALSYLHDQCVPRVLHRDVKPSNILLDEDFNAYLSDFGLARLLGTSETHATTGVAGTFGYVAPEYAMTCRVSDKADVYSYGVVLLELLSDKKALDPSFSSFVNGFNIVAWASMLLRQGRAKEFFAEGLWDAGPQDDLVEILHLAVVCTVDALSTRPTMRQVVRRLKQLEPPSS